ncbi:MAG: hypothetical protein GF331_02915 [Chitinivibrionales bacterium]|nr:hypothetical protein [Chitinivibrionales bacterium]
MAASNTQELIDAVGRFGSLRVMVLGDVMLDVYDFCSTADSKPIDSEMRGKRAYTAHESIRVLGGAGNVAANLAALGVQTTLVGVTGDDGYHFMLQKVAEDHGIDNRLLRDHGRQTTVKTRIYVDDEYLLRRDDETREKVSKELALSIQAASLEALGNCDAVVLSDYNKGFFTDAIARSVIDACAQRSIPVVVDFKPPNAGLFRGATVIAPNEGEADTLQGGFRGAPEPAKHMQRLHELLGCTSTMVTVGGRGIYGFDSGGFFHVNGWRVKVVDAVGCGDTVRATVALGLATGLSLRQSCVLANCAAATIIQKRATATISPDEVVAFMRQSA